MNTTPEKLSRLAERLATERVAARAIVSKLRDELDATWDRVLPDDWRTVGLAQETIAAADEILEQNPTQSRELAQFALAVLTAIPRDAYPAQIIAQVEAQAWRQLGTAHRYVSSYDAALHAFDAGRRALAPFNALGLDEATIELARTVVLSDLARQEEALALLNEIMPVFESYADQPRIARAKLMKGIIHWRRAELQIARAEFQDARVAAAACQDLHTLAAAYNNLGQVLIDLGDTASAASALHQARDLLLALELEAEITRTDHVLARLLMRGGEFTRASVLLESVRKRYLSKRLVEEAGVAALDIVDALVATGQRDAARSLSETVLAEFCAANLNTRAQTALAYLRDLLKDHPAPAPSIRHVRSYLEKLREEPTRAFLPLPEETR